MQSRIVWTYRIGSRDFEFDHTPFVLGHMKFFDCQFGRCYKPKKGQNQGNSLCLQGTRKKGCNAHITIREFILYPDFKVSLSPDMTKRQVRSLKEDAIKDLHKAKQDGNLNTVSKYYVCLPTEEAHHDTHQTRGQMCMCQKIHPKLVSKIYELVAEGIIETCEVKRALKVYTNEIKADGNCDPNDRAYNPTMKDISNHGVRAKKKLELLCLDQDNAHLKIET